MWQRAQATRSQAGSTGPAGGAATRHSVRTSSAAPSAAASTPSRERPSRGMPAPAAARRRHRLGVVDRDVAQIRPEPFGQLREQGDLLLAPHGADEPAARAAVEAAREEPRLAAAL